MKQAKVAEHIQRLYKILRLTLRSHGTLDAYTSFFSLGLLTASGLAADCVELVWTSSISQLDLRKLVL